MEKNDTTTSTNPRSEGSLYNPSMKNPVVSRLLATKNTKLVGDVFMGGLLYKKLVLQRKT